jgi:hypothetical protein
VRSARPSIGLRAAPITEYLMHSTAKKRVSAAQRGQEQFANSHRGCASMYNNKGAPGIHEVGENRDSRGWRRCPPTKEFIV